MLRQAGRRPQKKARKEAPVSDAESNSLQSGLPRSSTRPNKSGVPPCKIRTGAERMPVAFD
jgi:hypothetical protein